MSDNVNLMNLHNFCHYKPMTSNMTPNFIILVRNESYTQIHIKITCMGCPI